jgi:hypothetical protein
MERLGVGRVRARSQHGGEPAAGGLPHRPHEQGLRGIRFMAADGDTPTIGERIAERSMAMPLACGFGLPLGSRIELLQR